MTWEWILLGALALVLYTYFGYPGILLVWGYLRPRRGERGNDVGNGNKPLVSVVIAAYNERRNIARRIENLLQSDYPPDRMELLWSVTVVLTKRLILRRATNGFVS